MTFGDYQTKAARTRNPANSNRDNILNFVIGLAGETGEVAEIIKKNEFHDKPLNLDNLRKELGDVLWYLANLATSYDLSLMDIAEANIAKLEARYPDGFGKQLSFTFEPSGL